MEVLENEDTYTDTDISNLLYEIDEIQKEQKEITFHQNFIFMWIFVYIYIIFKKSYILYIQKSSRTLRTALNLLMIPYIVAFMKLINISFLV